MGQQLDAQTLRELLQSESVQDLSGDQLRRYFEQGLDSEFFSRHHHTVDPRDGTRVLFHPGRARRPHDHPLRLETNSPNQTEADCPICRGETTRIIDRAPLTEGFTFINKNLYPIFPPTAPASAPTDPSVPRLRTVQQVDATGFHFLQWTSSVHHHDWHNLRLEDLIVVLSRLAALEEKLIAATGGYVSIIKNHGSLVGGSLSHPHQQIAVSGIMPNRHRQYEAYAQAHGETFSAFMLRENPSELLIGDYGAAVLLTPYFMKRPFDMLLFLKDARKSHLYMLDRDERAAIAEGWRDATRIMLAVLADLGRAPAYNVVVHNGPGAGLHIEFLPYSQEMGGFEHLGLYVCQADPHQSAEQARTVREAGVSP
jgi:galactose-1-phosphate uridylyltransferase